MVSHKPQRSQSRRSILVGGARLLSHPTLVIAAYGRVNVQNVSLEPSSPELLAEAIRVNSRVLGR